MSHMQRRRPPFGPDRRLPRRCGRGLLLFCLYRKARSVQQTQLLLYAQSVCCSRCLQMIDSSVQGVGTLADPRVLCLATATGSSSRKRCVRPWEQPASCGAHQSACCERRALSRRLSCRRPAQPSSRWPCLPACQLSVHPGPTGHVLPIVVVTKSGHWARRQSSCSSQVCSTLQTRLAKRQV